MVHLLFFLSGFAALIYQVVWQRTLFSIYGINIEAVTMVVTAFMLGLGLGSLAGGVVSKDPKRPAVFLFAMVELGIALFGLFSLSIFRFVGNQTLLLSPFVIGLVTFLMVLVPTMLMGSTLPLLVGHFTRINNNVGRSVSSLYTINTLGSAVASFVAVAWALGHLGQLGSVRLAAGFNVVASIAAILVHRVESRKASSPASAST